MGISDKSYVFFRSLLNIVDTVLDESGYEKLLQSTVKQLDGELVCEGFKYSIYIDNCLFSSGTREEVLESLFYYFCELEEK